jgi:hypothetical protein
MKIVFEGTSSQVDSFYDFLHICKLQGMIQSFADVEHSEESSQRFSAPRRNYRQFEILQNFALTVVKGAQSGNEHDYNISLPSADCPILVSSNVSSAGNSSSTL